MDTRKILLCIVVVSTSLISSMYCQNKTLFKYYLLIDQSIEYCFYEVEENKSSDSIEVFILEPNFLFNSYKPFEVKIVNDNNDTIEAKMNTNRSYILNRPKFSFSVLLFQNSNLQYKQYFGQGKKEYISKIYFITKQPSIPVKYEIISIQQLTINQLNTIKESIITGEDNELVKQNICKISIVF
jgi:hypothetical protein